MGKKHIEAKPTVYGNICYKSRLEARWAVFLDHCGTVEKFQYEPVTLLHSKTQHTYTVDFLVNFVEGEHIYLEIKPTSVLADAVEEVMAWGVALNHELLVMAGSFYEDNLTPWMSEHADPDHIGVILGLLNDREAMQLAKTWRFDLGPSS